MLSEDAKDVPAGVTQVRSGSVAEAEREVTGWLAYLVENGRYDWE